MMKFARKDGPFGVRTEELTPLQAVEVALSPRTADNSESTIKARLDKQERMLAELIAVLTEKHVLSPDDVLRLIGRYQFQLVDRRMTPVDKG